MKEIPPLVGDIPVRRRRALAHVEHRGVFLWLTDHRFLPNKSPTSFYKAISST